MDCGHQVSCSGFRRKLPISRLRLESEQDQLVALSDKDCVRRRRYQVPAKQVRSVAFAANVLDGRLTST